MKPYDLKTGDRFKVADSCNPDELVDVYDVVEIDVRKTDIRGREVVVGVRMAVRVNGSEEVVPLGIGPWVEVFKVDPATEAGPSS